MSVRLWHWIAFVAPASCLYTCATIDPIVDGQCGNKVIEPSAGEDCDRYPSLGMACYDPGEANQCRFACDAVALTGCTSGYSCGIDGVCRAPSGRFNVAFSFDEDAAALVARDFDSDEIPDLLVRTSDDLVLAFLGAQLGLELSIKLPSFGAPAIGRLNEDALLDVAFATPQGVAVLRALENRGFAGTAYATITIPEVDGNALVATLDGDPGHPGEEAIALTQTPSEGALVLLVRVAQSGTPILISSQGQLPPLDDGAGPNIADVPTGALDSDPLDDDSDERRTPCDEYVLAFRNENRVWVGTPCKNDGDPNTAAAEAPLIEIDMAACAGFSVDRALIVDADNDAYLDVLLTPADGGASCIARGPLTFGKGALAALPAIGEPFENVLLASAKGGGLPAERALVVDHIDDDSILDWATTAGIFLSKPCGPPVAAPAHVGFCDVAPPTPAFEGPIAFARVGNLNADDHRDIVFANGYTDRVWVALAAGDGTYAPFQIETDNEATGDMAIGDFDGDGVDDLAFADRPCVEVTSECSDPDSLSLSFGRAAGGPEPISNIGQLGRIQALVVAKLASLEGGLDGIADLGVLFTEKADAADWNVAVLLGAADRQIQAPFVVGAQPVDGMFKSETPFGVVAGNFAQHPAAAQADLAVLADSPAPRLWLLEGQGDAQLSNGRSCPTDLPELPDDWLATSSEIAAANLDDDDDDEVVVVAGSGFLIANPVAGQPACFEISVIATDEQIYASISRDDEAAPRPMPLLVEDIDNDGLRDLVVIGVRGDEEVLTVYWNRGGTFTQDDRSSIPLATEPDAYASAAVAINLDGDPALEIVAVGPSFGVMRIDLDDALLFLPPVPLFDESNSQAVSEPRSIAKSDFDRDGVADLAFGSETAVTIYRGISTIDAEIQ
jgi:hypothetical protein